jgi:serine/threonine-protein kinase HipA
MIRLCVWANQVMMGWFGHSAGQYFFEYEAAWVHHVQAHPLAPQFPLRLETFKGEAVKTFFSNLLPEGAPLTEILNQMHLRNANTLEMIGTFGADLPGVLSVLPQGVEPSSAQQYTVLTNETLSARLQARHQSQPLLTSNEQTRMSLAGAQDKLGLRYDQHRGQLFDSIQGAPSTHIAKPDSRMVKYQPSAINEYLCMKLAAAMQLNVPPVHFLQVPQSVMVVQRYDRKLVDGRVVCLHQIDGCQLLDVGSDWKYQRQGDLVCIPKLVRALREASVPAKDLLQLQRWVMLNYLIGNSDAHAKNISLMIDSQGYRLAPFYDVLSVQAYGDNDLALYIGDEDTFHSVGAHSWEALCADCGFAYKPLMAIFRKMAQDISKKWDSVVSQSTRGLELSQAEKDVVARIGAVIETNRQAALSMIA